jgi:hypothetical protein
MTSSCRGGWPLERGLVGSLLVLLSRLEGSLIGFATTGWKEDFPKWKGEGGTLNIILRTLAEGLSAMPHGDFLVRFEIIRRWIAENGYRDKKDWKKGTKN